MSSVSVASAPRALPTIDDDDDWEIRPAATRAAPDQATALTSSSSTNVSTPAAVVPKPAAKVASGAGKTGGGVMVTDTANLTEEEKSVLDMMNPIKDFMRDLHDLLTCVSQVFPRCTTTKLYLTYFKTYYKDNQEKQEELIKLWHQTMAPYYQDVHSSDEKRHERVVNADIDLFQKLEMPKKWSSKGFSAKSRKNLIARIARINKYSNTYCEYHVKFQSKVLAAADEIRQQIESGQVDEEDISFEMLMKKGAELGETMSDEDLAQVMQNLPALMKSHGGDLGGTNKAGGMDMLFKMMGVGK